MYTLTREHNTIIQWEQVTAPFRESIREFPSPGLLKFTNLFFKAVSFIGEGELYARQAERCQVLQIQSKRAEFCMEKFTDLNTQGIEVLAHSLEALNEFRKDLMNYTKIAGNKLDDVSRDEKIDQYRIELYEVFVDMEAKKSDLEEIDKEVRELLALVDAEGFMKLPDYIEERVNLLMEFRQRPDRGAQGNITPWKLYTVIGICIALGLAFFIHCGIFGCNISSRDNYIAAIITTLLLFWC